eukprot:scaffold3165_cov85-Cylindrotheca_fusiformis.AAC.2
MRDFRRSDVPNQVDRRWKVHSLSIFGIPKANSPICKSPSFRSSDEFLQSFCIYDGNAAIINRTKVRLCQRTTSFTEISVFSNSYKPLFIDNECLQEFAFVDGIIIINHIESLVVSMFTSVKDSHLKKATLIFDFVQYVLSFRPSHPLMVQREDDDRQKEVCSQNLDHPFQIITSGFTIHSRSGALICADAFANSYRTKKSQILLLEK